MREDGRGVASDAIRTGIGWPAPARLRLPRREVGDCIQYPRFGAILERIGGGTMIVHKFWKATRRNGQYGPVTDRWLREGWFLFGFIPLYIRDRENREKL